MGRKQGEVTYADRLKIVRLHLEEKVPIVQLSKDYGYSRTVIQSWIATYKKRGESGLKLTGSRSNAKVDPATKLQVVLEYLNDDVTFVELQAQYGYTRRTIGKWVQNYEEFGEEGLASTRKHNIRYDKVFKLKVVKDYLSGDLTQAQIAQKYDIGERACVEWARRYQRSGESGLERVDTFAHRYTPEFKEFIVLQHVKRNLTFRTIEERFGVSHETARTWHREYKKDGIKALQDKTLPDSALEDISIFKISRMDIQDDEMDIAQLRRKIKLLEIENEYLKKVQTLDRNNSLQKKK